MFTLTIRTVQETPESSEWKRTQNNVHTTMIYIRLRARVKYISLMCVFE